MKKSFTIISLAIVFLAVFITVDFSNAGERMKVVEMADGNLVTFRMTPEEIATEDAAKAELEKRKAEKTVKPAKRVVTFEMVESGRIVSFPMTEKEIATGDTENARLKALRDANARKPKPQVVKFELPESGNHITFPVTKKKNTTKTIMNTAKKADGEAVK
jgi:hypothetical protein